MDLRQFAGRVVDLDARSVLESNGSIIGASEAGIVISFFYADETAVAYLARIGVPDANIPRFVKMLDTLARKKGIDWQGAEIEEMPDFPAPH